jgi:hypothetical protein
MSKDNQTPPPAPTGEVQRFSVRELAVMTGNVTQRKHFVRTSTAGFERSAYTWQHNAAAQLHGWTLHEQHSAEPLRLTKDEYEAALKAASETVTRAVKDGKPGRKLEGEEAVRCCADSKTPTVTRYEPHRAACSPFLAKEAE